MEISQFAGGRREQQRRVRGGRAGGYDDYASTEFETKERMDRLILVLLQVLLALNKA